MKAELQFFMLPSDQATFLQFAETHIDHINTDQTLCVGDCELLFQASSQVDNALFIGKLSINSGGLDEGCQDHNRANAIYRTLRKWIKKHYDNRLSTWTSGKKDSIGRTRNQWLAPDAKQWKQKNPNADMRFSIESAVHFDIAPEFSQMGGIEPKGKKFKARSKN